MCTIFWIACLLTAALNAREVTIIAHRGNSTEAPENTLAAFKSAAALGVDFIECDVHLTRDKVPFVIHDRIVCRTADASFPIFIESMTATALDHMDAGIWFDTCYGGEKIPRLADVLEANLGNTGLVIELKKGSATDKEIATAAFEDLRGKGYKEVYLASDSPSILHEVVLLDPSQPIIAIASTLDEYRAHQKNNPDIFAIESNLATPTLINEIKKRGEKVWVFIVDDPKIMELQIANGVDGIITNKPRLLKKII